MINVNEIVLVIELYYTGNYFRQEGSDFRTTKFYTFRIVGRLYILYG